MTPWHTRLARATLEYSSMSAPVASAFLLKTATANHSSKCGPVRVTRPRERRPMASQRFGGLLAGGVYSSQVGEPVFDARRITGQPVRLHHETRRETDARCRPQAPPTPAGRRRLADRTTLVAKVGGLEDYRAAAGGESSRPRELHGRTREASGEEAPRRSGSPPPPLAGEFWLASAPFQKWLVV
jgi:hypothetical protein